MRCCDNLLCKRVHVASLHAWMSLAHDGRHPVGCELVDGAVQITALVLCHHHSCFLGGSSQRESPVGDHIPYHVE
jgi:hypothetical protein